MPCTPVGIGVGVGGVSEGAMHTLADVIRRRSVGGGANERVCELDARADLEETGFGGWVDGDHVEPEDLSNAVEQHRIAERLGGGGDSEQAGVVWEIEQPLHVALLDPPGHRLVAGEPEPAREIGGTGPGPRELEKGERIALALRDDPVAYGVVQRAEHVVEQEHPGVALAEPGDGELWQPGEDAFTRACARCAHDCDALGMNAASDERVTWAEVSSSHCASSTMHTSGFSSATSAMSVSVARPTRKRSGGGRALKPNTVASASRCGSGSRSSRPMSGAQSWWSPLYASSISDSIPAALTTCQPVTRSAK